MPQAAPSPAASMTRSTILLLLAAAFLTFATLTTGCASYMAPGRQADFRALGITAEQAEAMTDASIAARLSRRPAAAFPASIASVRVQAADYRSYSYERPGQSTGGLCHIITIREFETAEQFERLSKLPMIAGIAPVNRLMAPSRVNDEKDLRLMAAAVQADMLLIYTMDTVFGSETIVPALGTITLGVFPAKEARVTSTASAALVDTRTGYIYALAEGTSKTTQLANAWTTKDAIEQSRRRAEADAFGKLVGELETAWNGVVARYLRPEAPAQENAGAPEGDAQRDRGGVIVVRP